MNNSFKKTFSLILILFFVFSPIFSLAQEVDTTNAPKAIPVSQAESSYNGFSQSGSSSSGGIATSVASAGGCAFGNVAATAVRNSISSIVGSFANPTTVPTNNPQEDAKSTGIAAMPSWDSMAFCLVNAIIEYIGYATVQWINTGFNDSPVFVQDPALFFQQIADIEAGNFLNELSNGYLCSPFAAPVRIRLAQNYNNDFMNRAMCTFTGISGNMEQFLSGESFSWVDWNSYLSNPWNNEFGATIYGQIALDQRIASALGVQSTLLEWGRGFFSIKDENNNITSPGSLIESRVNDRLGSPERRLEIADEFDEIINALVNQLIRVSLSEISGSSFSGGSYQGGYYDDYSDRLSQFDNLNREVNGERTDQFNSDKNGKCSTKQDECKKGLYRDLDDGEKKYKWKCVGAETTEVCSLDKEISKITVRGIPQMLFVKICRDDFFGYTDDIFDDGSGKVYDYDGSCLPTKNLEYSFTSINQIPYYVPMCRIPVALDSNLAKQYFDGTCVPPRDTNIEWIKENKNFAVKMCVYDDGTGYSANDGSCFPVNRMMFDYVDGDSTVPQYARLCELDSGVNPTSDEAKEFYKQEKGSCIPPTTSNIDYIYLYTFGK